MKASRTRAFGALPKPQTQGLVSRVPEEKLPEVGLSVSTQNIMYPAILRIQSFSPGPLRDSAFPTAKGSGFFFGFSGDGSLRYLASHAA